MTKRRNPEAALAKPVANWLRAHGLVVYAEVCFHESAIDLVGWNEKTGNLVAVELKRSLTKKVIRQAMFDQIAAPFVYVAVGTWPRQSGLLIAKKLRLGVLSVEWGRVNCVLRAKRYDSFQPEKEHLIETLRMEAPSDEGGAPCRLGEGPAQECAKAVRAYIAEHPGCAWKDVFQDVPNHYSTVRSLQGVMNSRFGIYSRS